MQIEKVHTMKIKQQMYFYYGTNYNSKGNYYL